ncbi:MAG TPA: hypothetical protein DCQ31_12910 [Bacteroidales bacterium]|nr:hypothetical protein [Bacteroidales bacterium]
MKSGLINNILLIDDFRISIETISAMLEDEGYKVVGVQTPESALEILVIQSFDLILVDFLMPKKNGVQFAKEIKAMEPFKKIPIIIFSAKNDSVFIENAYNVGVDGWISKPFTLDKLNFYLKKLNLLNNEQETNSNS